MTAIPPLPDTERRSSYSPVASTGPFNVTFAIYGDSTDYQNWLEVWLNGSKLNATVDWTLSSPSGPFANLARPIIDAQVTLTLPQTGDLEIVGAERPRRTVQLIENQPWTAANFNQAFTEIKAMLRETWDLVKRATVGAPGDDVGFLPALAARLNSGVGSLAGYDGFTGDPIAIPTNPTSFANYTAINYTANSTTALAIATGAKNFVCEAGKLFVANQWVLAYSKSNNANNMLCQITSYSGTAMNTTCVATGGSGSPSDWTIVLANSVAAAGLQPPAGTGNVTGPGSSTAAHLATFADGTGKVIADGGAAGALASLSSVAAQYLAASAIAFGVGMLNGTIVESHAGNALTVAVKTLAGADPSAGDPVYFLVRDATPGLGDYVVRTVTAALNITISAGGLMGFASGTAGRLWACAFDDAGTIRLGLINCLANVAGAISIYPLQGWGIATTVADNGSGGSTLAQTFYTPNGHALTSKAYHPLGYLTWEGGLTSAGQWNASPTRINLARGSLPGQPVQPVHATFTGATTSSGTTQTQTSTTLSITPTSAANPILVNVNGNFQSVGGAVAAQISRGSTPTLIGSQQIYVPSASSFPITPVSMMAFDFPGVSSAVTYFVYIHSISAGACNWNPAQAGLTPTTAMTLQEIMA